MRCCPYNYKKNLCSGGVLNYLTPFWLYLEKELYFLRVKVLDALKIFLGILSGIIFKNLLKIKAKLWHRGTFADEKEAFFPLTRGLNVILSAYSGVKTSN